MSNRTAQANKAVSQAWINEQKLVKEGRGTRDWSLNQQKDILEFGRAYDENGKAIQGHHMKSVEANPELQGDPRNIQFLSREEHKAAHFGDFHIPTNGFYDPVTGETEDFVDGPYIPCRIIELSDPVVTIEPSGEKDRAAIKDRICKTKSEEKVVSSSKNKHDPLSYHTAVERANTKPTASRRSSNPAKVPQSENGFIKGLKTVGRFIINHPVESIEIAGTVIVGGIAAINGSRNKSGGSSIPNFENSAMNSSKKAIATKVADIVEKATRAENDVMPHKQRYHTKSGVIWKNKASYHRGGKDS